MLIAQPLWLVAYPALGAAFLDLLRSPNEFGRQAREVADYSTKTSVG